jgi:toxin ParE1/3/4
MKQLKYRYAPIAERDMESAHDALFAQQVDRDLKFQAQFERLMENVGSFPEMGKVTPVDGSDFRSMPLWDYIVFYSVQPDYIRVERVLHGARDLEAAMRESDLD